MITAEKRSINKILKYNHLYSCPRKHPLNCLYNPQSITEVNYAKAEKMVLTYGIKQQEPQPNTHVVEDSTKYPQKFFTSDLHFGHKNVLKFTKRSEVTTVENHTEWLIEMWNTKVQPGDTVYHMGDFAFIRSYDKIVEIISKLNGQIHLIYGNHDNTKYSQRLVTEGYAVWSGYYKEIKIRSTKTCLFHFPITAWYQQHRGAFHLFGHCHGGFFSGSKGKCLDVGIDNAYKVLGEHTLFTERDVIDYMNTQKLYIADEH